MTPRGEGDHRRLRILLIAYEFPPSPSPQSLRWAFLSNRIAALGHEVHVLAPDVAGSSEGLPDPGPGVQIHRTWPGPVRALSSWAARRRLRAVSTSAAPHGAANVTSALTPGFSRPAAEEGCHLDLLPSAEPPRLNWKGRLDGRVQSIASLLLFPDVRAEWKRPARRALHVLLDELKPDVVVSSHEPATTLQLGIEAKVRGFRWVADLGDPVLAPYTPQRWRRRAFALERDVVRKADHVLITAAAARELLRSRHGRCAPMTVVTQGFDEQFATGSGPVRSPGGPLELLYTGSFYSFRDPRALVDAVLSVPGVRLSIASANVPEWLADVERTQRAQVRLLGRIPHRQLLALQRHADVLINMANADRSQVPGKLYEYLGAGRPVLHLLSGQALDAPGELIRVLRRGWVCEGQREPISSELERLVELQRKGALDADVDLRPGTVAPWSWSSVATAAAAVLADSAGRAGP